MAHWQVAMTERAQIIEALTARDTAGLNALLRRHLGSTWSQLSLDQAV